MTSAHKPGRELDAAVAEALGWSRILPSGKYLQGHTPNGGFGFVPAFSTSPADALAALEATGLDFVLCKWQGATEADESKLYRCDLAPTNPCRCEGCGHDKYQHWEYGETLCLAACAAILVWAAHRPPASERGE